MRTSDEYEIVCQNIRYLRQTQGLSRTVMARKLHITIKTLDLLESGIFPDRIHVGFLFHVWQAFGISPPDLLSNNLSETKP